MKRRILAVILFVSVMQFISANNFHFFLTPFKTHPDVVRNLVPTLFVPKFSYDGWKIKEPNYTELVFDIGGGFSQRTVWQTATGVVMDPKVIVPNPYTYDAVQIIWNAYLYQGIGEVQQNLREPLSIYVGYEGRYEQYVPTFDMTTSIVGEKRGDFFLELNNGLVYPDLKGKQKFLSSVLVAGVSFDMMVDQQVTQSGIKADAALRLAPKFINSFLEGEASYGTLSITGVGAVPLIHLSDSEGFNVLSITLVDRFSFSAITGSDIPVFVQEKLSTGSMTRGFSKNTYNTQFSIVNNAEIRIVSPEPFIDGICPRLNLFLDAGLYFGKYVNSTQTGAGLIASTGAEMTISFYDYMDIGYYIAYLLNGMNFAYETNTAGSKVVSGIMMFLQY